MGGSISAACTCHMGHVRKNNEDNLYFHGRILPQDNTGLRKIVSLDASLSEAPCFAVFDGMGGEAWGEEAAWTAADTMQKTMQAAKSYIYQPKSFLEQLIQSMNQAVCEHSANRMSGRMGSTAAILYFDEGQVYQCNLGDSRAFRLRDSEFLQLSKNHTDELFLMENGITRKPRLTQHLGIWPEEMILEPYIVKCDILPGDIYLLCSDGLTDMLTNTEICEILKQPIHASEHVRLLTDRALAAGGKDNITVIAVKVNH